MPNHAFRIRFPGEQEAHDSFEGFMDAAGWITNCARKRVGSDHVVLLRDCSDLCREHFVRWCEARPGVVGIQSITEKEFWSLPSHAV